MDFNPDIEYEDVDDRIGCCEECGQMIFDGDAYYEFPDCFIVCDDITCILEHCRKHYRHPGSR